MEVEYGNLPFDEAIEYFGNKGVDLPSVSLKEVWLQARGRAFTVAHVTAIDIVEDIRGAVREAIAGGQSLGEFRRGLKTILEKKGWFAKKGGDAKLALPDGTIKKRLTAWRIETIYRANLQTAYAVGRYRQQIESYTRPYWQYMAILDAGTRSTHAAQNGKVYRRDHSFWDQWYPPNGYNCRCYVKTLSDRQVAQRDLSVETRGSALEPDEGWRYNPGKEDLEGWHPDLTKYDPEARAILEKALD